MAEPKSDRHAVRRLMLVVDGSYYCGVNITTARISSIDVLRGFAALGVFFFHVSGALEFPKHTLPPFVLLSHEFKQIPSIFSLGAAGVNLFFVLSGFCLSLKPLGSFGKLEVGAYYRDRFARIYPAYAVAVIFSVLVVELRGIQWSLTMVGSVLIFLQGAVQKWHFAINGSLWSMSTEVQFYLAFPFLFTIFYRRGVAFLGVVAGVVMAFRILFAYMPAAADVVGGINTGTFLMNTLAGRVTDFLLGMFVARLWTTDPVRLKVRAQWVVLPAVVLGVVVRAKGPTWLADPILGVMCAAVFAFVLMHFSWTPHSWLARFGRVSYSFFLLHLPVVNLVVDSSDFLRVLPPYSAFVVASLVAFAAALPLSWLLYRYVELPCMRWIKSVAGTRRPCAVIDS